MEQGGNDISDFHITSYLNGDLMDSEQRMMVEGWLKDPENQEKAREVYRSWELSVIAAPNEIDTSEPYRKLSARLFGNDEVENQHNKEARVFPLYRWAVAASVVGIGLLLGVWLITKDTEQSLPLTTISEVQDYQLMDKSFVSLNESSKLSFDMKQMEDVTSETREAWLEGEGFFEVESMPERPFIVHTRDATITVLGTKFLVREQEGLPTKVLVTEGKVEVFYHDTEQRFILEAEEEVALVSNNEKEVAVKVSESDNNQLYWKTGVMTFENQSLAHVFETLSEEFDVVVLAENQNIFECELTATFKKQSLETILKVIGTTHELESTLSSDTLTISGDGCR